MLPAQVRGMALLGISTVFIGGTTTILAVATLWLMPYHIVLQNVSISVSVLSIGVNCCSVTMSRAFMWMQGLVHEDKILAGWMILLWGAFGCFILVRAVRFYSVSGHLEPQAHLVDTVIHALHGLNGVAIVVSAIFAAITRSRKTDLERDPEREPAKISEHNTSGNHYRSDLETVQETGEFTCVGYPDKCGRTSVGLFCADCQPEFEQALERLQDQCRSYVHRK